MLFRRARAVRSLRRLWVREYGYGRKPRLEHARLKSTSNGCIALRCVALCFAMLRCVLLFSALLCSALLCSALLCCTRCVALCYAVTCVSSICHFVRFCATAPLAGLLAFTCSLTYFCLCSPFTSTVVMANIFSSKYYHSKNSQKLPLNIQSLKRAVKYKEQADFALLPKIS